MEKATAAPAPAEVRAVAAGMVPVLADPGYSPAAETAEVLAVPSAAVVQVADTASEPDTAAASVDLLGRRCRRYSRHTISRYSHDRPH